MWLEPKGWNPKETKAKLEKLKQMNAENDREVAFEDKLIRHRESFLPLEFLVEKNGKRFMNGKTTRALQSKISLKFPLTSLEKEKAKLRPTIK